VGIIKFADERDGNYERVSQDIGNLLDTTLPKISEATLVEWYPSPLASWPSSSSGDDESNSKDMQDDDVDIDTQISRKIGPKVSSGLHWSFHKVNPASRRNTTSILRQDTSTPQRERRPTLIAPAVSQTKKNWLLSLRRFHTVFILDDSGSMNEPTQPAHLEMSRWKGLIDCMVEICDVAKQSVDDGIDIHFLVNRHRDTMNVRSGQQVWEILTDIDIESSRTSRLGDVLWKVLNDYLEKCRNYIYKKGVTGTFLKSLIQAPKPLNVIVVTDGVTDDHEEVEAALVRATRALPRLKIPDFQIGVQFVQVGKDPSVTRWLKLLDDKIRGLYGIRDVSI
jgi:hypothetical protein